MPVSHHGMEGRFCHGLSGSYHLQYHFGMLFRSFLKTTWGRIANQGTKGSLYQTAAHGQRILSFAIYAAFALDDKHPCQPNCYAMRRGDSDALVKQNYGGWPKLVEKSGPEPSSA